MIHLQAAAAQVSDMEVEMASIKKSQARALAKYVVIGRVFLIA